MPRIARFPLGLAAVLAVLLACGRAESVASSPPAPGQASRPAGASFDHTHAAWTALLAKYVHGGRVNYTGLRGDLPRLRAYRRSLEAVGPAEYEGWSRKQKIAFWANAYNAYTITLILDHWPVESIKDIGGWFSSPFKQEFIPMKRLRGATISLDTIEHEILRKTFHEPRLHFALVCASKGCPPLRAEAYRAADLDEQLDDQARTFLADRTRNRFDLAERTLRISPIFKWFREDFEGAADSVPAFLARFVDAPAAAALRDGGDWRVKYTDYDWTLNGS